MCGFVSVINKSNNPVDQGLVKTMNNLILHRGPDQEGYFFSDNIGFGFRRLAILDLSEAGRQPMQTSDGRYIIVFNGEIYNYLELREELKVAGYSFRSRTDTEVLLNAYLYWGESCLNKLNGMWAFIIYDTAHKTIFGARDRFGVKPLYYYENDEQLMFASEIKSIRDSGCYRKAVDWSTLAGFMIGSLMNHTNSTFYREIYSIPPGAAFTVDRNSKLRIRQYWTLSTIQDSTITNPIPNFFSLFEDSVRLRLRADVPVGVFLSGGLDSTAIICSMARVWPKHAKGKNELYTFSFIDKDFDESTYINDTIKQTNAKLIPIEKTANELYDSLQKVLWFHDEPVHSMTALVGFSLMELAIQHGVKVVLNGQGADEILAGYHSYRSNYWYTLISKGKIKKALSEIRKYSKFHNIPFKELLGYTVNKTVNTSMNTMQFVRQLKFLLKSEEIDNSSWYCPELLKQTYVGQGNYDMTLTGVLQESLEKYPLPLYLRIEDRNSMGNSVEARLPFMDYRLVSYVFKLNDEYKMNGQWNKYILRQAMKNQIPESVRMRVDKMGFPTPTKKWFSGPLFEVTMDTLASQSFKENGIFNQSAIINDLKQHRKGAIDISDKLFDVLQLNIWMSEYT